MHSPSIPRVHVGAWSGLLRTWESFSWAHPAAGCPSPLPWEDSALLLADFAEGVGAAPSSRPDTQLFPSSHDGLSASPPTWQRGYISWSWTCFCRCLVAGLVLQSLQFLSLTGPNLPSLTLWLSLAVRGLVKPLTNLSIGYK